jgi:hypothetical protein
MSQTTAGAIRAFLLEGDPTLQVYRNEAPTGSQTPVIVVSDPFVSTTIQLGDHFAIEETLQIDLYIDYSEISPIADYIHQRLYRCVVSLEGSQVFRCTISERTKDAAEEGNEDGIDRITFTASVKRIINR